MSNPENTYRLWDGCTGVFHPFCKGCADIETETKKIALYADEPMPAFLQTEITCKHYDKCARIARHIQGTRD